jgi:hypothetical protein
MSEPLQVEQYQEYVYWLNSTVSIEAKQVIL